MTHRAPSLVTASPTPHSILVLDSPNMASKVLRACEHLVAFSKATAAEHFATADTDGDDRGTVWGVIGGAWAAVVGGSVFLVALVWRHGGISLLLLGVGSGGRVHRSDGRWQTVG